MRKPLVCAICLVLLQAAPALAQTPYGPSFDPDLPNPGFARRAPLPNHLIFERAQYQASMRTARIEARRWMGISPSRPTVQMQPATLPVYPAPAWTYPGYRMQFQIPLP
jgi:hypothetical protein